MTAANFEIHTRILKNNIEAWRIASLLNLSDSDFRRLLQEELPPAGKAMVAAALKKLLPPNQRWAAQQEPVKK